MSATVAEAAPAPLPGAAFRRFVIALTAFFTLVDLFAAQAILPALAAQYHVGPATMGIAVNASTAGMAVGSLLAALFGGRIGRGGPIAASLVLLALPTAALAFAPGIGSFAALRVAQGLCMATAFSLTLAWLGECTAPATRAAAFAAYVTGNVASNLVGRLLSAALAAHLGTSGNFLVLAGLNLAGAVLVRATVTGMPPMGAAPRATLAPLRNPALLAAFGIGFCILFAFIGAFSYVNFVLARPPLGLGMMSLGLVYFVFLPSIFTTPLAGGLAARHGTRRVAGMSLALAAAGLPLMLLPVLPAVLLGMVLLACGSFAAQAVATGFTAAAAGAARAQASGFYLTAYFAGGLAGSAIVGRIFEHAGWPAAVAAILAALLASCALTPFLHTERTP